jgi:Trypsin-like peptidase domain
MLLTALHVAANAEASANNVLIGWLPPQPTKPFEFRNAVIVQRWPHVDMAAIMVLGMTFSPLPWNASNLPLLTQVRAYGFPHGYTGRALNHRAFAGPIVGHSKTDDFPGQPEVYELQFAAPLGLSGAALLTDDLRVAGCIVGNATSMLARRGSTQAVREPNRTKDGELDLLHLGVAICSSELLRLRFDDGSTIRDAATKLGLSILTD